MKLKEARIEEDGSIEAKEDDWRRFHRDNQAVGLGMKFDYLIIHEEECEDGGK